MRSRVAASLLGVFMATAAWPASALAQSAGVVTTLTGQATVARGPAERLQLKFKDDVFFRDKVTTAQESVAKLLLGGKALVTVRELSTLTVTEEAQRSTVDLDNGKVALAVARQRMRPGEVVEIRTPNAIAAVRGTVVVVEVIQASAQAAPAPPPPVTNLYVLSGLAEILLRNVPGATPTSVGPGFGLSVTGNILGAIRPNPPVAQIVAGLQAGKQIKEPPAQAKEQAAKSGQAQAAVDAGIPLTVTPSVTVAPVVQVTSQAPPILPGNATTTTPVATAPPPPPTTTLTPPFSGFVNWNASARDLDLHVTGPDGAGGRFHVFFANPGSLTAQPFTFLHQDCTCFSGNEATTIQQVNAGGVYRFSVFNFGNSVPLPQSGANFRFIQGGTVTNLGNRDGGGSIVSGGTVIATFSVPTTGQGDTWVIGEYNPATSTFTPTNTIVTSGGSAAVQLRTPKMRR
jgi:hypothetical protein